MTADVRLMRWPARERDDYRRLAEALQRVRHAASAARGEIVAPSFDGPQEPSDLDRARVLFAQRRARDRSAGRNADLFADPAWDMLLALFIAQGEGRALAVADACTLSCVAPAAALRWLDVLVARELVAFDDGDGRPTKLTQQGGALVARCIRDL